MIHRPPRGSLHCPLPTADYLEYCTKMPETLPSPGTPGSGASDSSMGYSSSHSLPSVFSTPGPSVAKSNRDGNGSIGERSQTASHSTGYDTDMSHHQRPNSVCSLAVTGAAGSSRHAVSGSPALTLHRGSSQSSQLAVGHAATPSTNSLQKNSSDLPGSTLTSSLHFSTRQSGTPTFRSPSLQTPGGESTDFHASEEQSAGLHKPPGEQQTCL